MGTLEERVAVLEVKTDSQQNAINDHEDRIREQEEVKAVVNGLVETTKNLKDTSEVLVSTMNDIKIEKAKTEGLIDMLKNIKPKDVIYVVIIIILLVSSVTGIRVNMDTVDTVKELTDELSVEKVIDNADSASITN